jgi:hypothetical protein
LGISGAGPAMNGGERGTFCAKARISLATSSK